MSRQKPYLADALKAEELGFQTTNVNLATLNPLLKCNLYIRLTDEAFHGVKVYKAQDLNGVADSRHILAILLNFGKRQLYLKATRYSAIINAMKPNDAQLLFCNTSAGLSKCFLLLGQSDIDYVILTKYHLTMAVFGARLRLAFLLSPSNGASRKSVDLYTHIWLAAVNRVEIEKSTGRTTIVGLCSSKRPIYHRNGLKGEMSILHKNNPLTSLALTFDLAQIYKRVACEAALHINGRVSGNANVGRYFLALSQYENFVFENGLITRWNDPGGTNWHWQWPKMKVYFSSLYEWREVKSIDFHPLRTHKGFEIHYVDSGTNYLPPYMMRPGQVRNRVTSNVPFEELSGITVICPEDIHFFKFTKLPEYYSITIYIYKMPENFIHVETPNAEEFENLQKMFCSWLGPAVRSIDFSKGLIASMLNSKRSPEQVKIDNGLLNGLMHSSARGSASAKVEQMMQFPSYGTTCNRMNLGELKNYQETCSLIVSDIKQTMQQALTRLAMVLVENEADKWSSDIQVTRDRSGSLVAWKKFYRLGLKAMQHFCPQAPRYWSVILRKRTTTSTAQEGQNTGDREFRLMKPQYRFQFSDHNAPF